jgi:hypothetical protein
LQRGAVLQHAGLRWKLVAKAEECVKPIPVDN